MAHSPGEGLISGLISFSLARSILFTIWSNKFLKSILIYSRVSLPFRCLRAIGVEVGGYKSL